MKNKAFILLKQIIKNNTQVAKRRLVELSLTMKSKKLSLLGNMSNKIHSILGQHEEEEEERQENIVNQSNAIIMFNEANSSSNLLVEKAEVNDEMIEHSILDDDNEEGSLIDLVKKSKEEGEYFSLEDEIDNVADLFIRRFHKEIRMQKLESFKRYQEMLARNV